MEWYRVLSLLYTENITQAPFPSRITNGGIGGFLFVCGKYHTVLNTSLIGAYIPRVFICIGSGDIYAVVNIIVLTAGVLNSQTNPPPIEKVNPKYHAPQ